MHLFVTYVLARVQCKFISSRQLAGCAVECNCNMCCCFVHDADFIVIGVLLGTLSLLYRYYLQYPTNIMEFLISKRTILRAKWRNHIASSNLLTDCTKFKPKYSNDSIYDSLCFEMLDHRECWFLGYSKIPGAFSICGVRPIAFSRCTVN